jgi:hypothetical protein
MLHLLAMETEQMHQYDTLDLTGTKGRACPCVGQQQGQRPRGTLGGGRWRRGLCGHQGGCDGRLCRLHGHQDVVVVLADDVLARRLRRRLRGQQGGDRWWHAGVCVDLAAIPASGAGGGVGLATIRARRPMDAVIVPASGDFGFLFR